tara:strand:+ start:305 stop:577 length:273 start_codon:yes stop_codon:yes gene_type:complete
MNDKSDSKIVSPCISICKTDYSSGYCYGCARTDKEKIIWKDEKTTNQWKVENINELIQRMNGWQLEAFMDSYKHKIKTGMSIFKKNQVKK